MHARILVCCLLSLSSMQAMRTRGIAAAEKQNPAQQKDIASVIVERTLTRNEKVLDALTEKIKQTAVQLMLASEMTKKGTIETLLESFITHASATDKYNIRKLVQGYEIVILPSDKSIRTLAVPWRLKRTKAERREAIKTLLTMLAHHYKPASTAYQLGCKTGNFSTYRSFHEEGRNIRDHLEALIGLNLLPYYEKPVLASYIVGLPRIVPITEENIEQIVDMLII